MLNKFNWVFFLVLVVLISAFTFPVVLQKANQPTHLFYLGRSKDANQIFYDLNFMADGQLDTVQPIKAYWVKFAEDGRQEPLTTIQNSFAYGLDFEMKSNGDFEFNFVSYPSRKLLLKRDNNGVYKVYMNSTLDTVILEAIYVKIDGGTFWVPNVTSVSVYGKFLSNALAFEEHIIP